MQVYIEFLLYLLTYRNNENKLEDSLFCLLASTEFIRVMRGISIIAVCITNPFCWLVGKTYQLAEYDWSARCMLRVHDNLKIALEEITDNSFLFLKEHFIKNIFKGQIKILEPFKEFLECKFSIQEKCCVKDLEDTASKI